MAVPTSIPVSSRESNPRIIALLLLAFGFLLTIILYIPISKVFAGEWIMNQQISLIENAFIDFKAIGISGITNSFGWDEIVPIGTISIRFYAISILLGLLSGYILALHLAKSQYIAGTIIDRLIIGLIIFGLIGARLFYVAFNWEFFRDTPQAIFTEILSGGLAFFGMFIACFSYVWVYCKRFKFNLYEFADILAPAVLLGQIIGRWGNFFNYESYGPETSVFWKMYVPPTANYYSDLNATFFHPTFLYEIIPNFILLVFLMFFYKRLTEKRSGLVFAIYAIGYGLIRFFVEFFRLDALRLSLPHFLQFEFGAFGKLEFVLVSQIAALILLLIGVITWIQRNKVIYIKKDMSEFKIS